MYVCIGDQRSLTLQLLFLRQGLSATRVGWFSHTNWPASLVSPKNWPAYSLSITGIAHVHWHRCWGVKLGPYTCLASSLLIEPSPPLTEGIFCYVHTFTYQFICSNVMKILFLSIYIYMMLRTYVYHKVVFKSITFLQTKS